MCGLGALLAKRRQSRVLAESVAGDAEEVAEGSPVGIEGVAAEGSPVATEGVAAEGRGASAGPVLSSSMPRRRSPKTERGKWKWLLRLGLEVPMSRATVAARVNAAAVVAKHAKRAGNVLEGCAATASVVNSGVALRWREELQPDCGTRVRVSKGKDGRTYIAAGMNRRCFKDLSPLGAFENRRGVFGLASGFSQSTDCTVCVASTIFEEQKIALEKTVDDGGSSCCIVWEMGSTPMRTVLTSGIAIDHMNRNQNETKGNI